MRNIENAAWDFLQYSFPEKKLFMKLAVRSMSLDESDKLLDAAIRARLEKEHGGTFTHPAVETYMEQQLRRNMKTTPAQIAQECVSYEKLRPAMKPWAIKTAQRVKDRLRRQEARLRARAANGH